MLINENIRALVFDFDGTLVESNAIKRDCFFEVAGGECDREWLDGVLEQCGRDRYSIICEITQKMGLATEAYDGMLDKYNSITRARISSLPPIKGVMGLLKRCRDADIECFISSATPLTELDIILAKHPLKPWFKSIHGKPSTKLESLEHIIDMHGYDNENVLVVGDGQDDLDSANARGCYFMAVGAGVGENMHNEEVHAYSDLEKRIFDNG